MGCGRSRRQPGWPDGATRWEGVIIDVTDQHRESAARLQAERERTALVEQLREQNQTCSAKPMRYAS